MAVTQPISGAKVGEPTSAVGTPEVVNQRQGVFARSVPPSWVVSSSSQVRDAAGFTKLVFEFEAPPPVGGNFDFGGDQLVYAHAYAAFDEWGAPTVGNAAQDIRPVGIAGGAVSNAVVAFATTYAKYVLDLQELPPTRFHFVFSGSQILATHGRHSERWGVPEVKSPLVVWHSGFKSTREDRRFGGVSVLHRATLDTFTLDLSSALDGSTNFPFSSPQRLRTVTFFEQTRWGAPTVGNTAQDIRPTSLVSSVVATPFLSVAKRAWVPFAFDQGYAHPHTTNLGFYFAGGKQIDVPTWDSSEFGGATVYLHLQPVRPTGAPSSAAFGVAALDHFAAKIRPDGLPSSVVFGTPTLPKVVKPHAWDSLILQNFTYVYNYNQHIVAYPFTGQPITPPSPKVYNLLQFLHPTGKASSFAAGAVRVSNYLRSLYANGLAVTHTFGTTKVNLGRRYITNAYISTTLTSFGTPFISWGDREVYPVGSAFTTFGAPLVKEKAQRCYPVGRASLVAFGTPLVRDRTQRFYPFALDSNLYGTGFVYLWKQEIRPAGILQWEFEKDRFGYYTEASLKNKQITTNGYVDSRFSITALVYNGARRVSVWSTIPMTRYGTAFVAPRVRSFGVAWYTQEVFGTPYVRTRQVISLDGWGIHSMRFGIPSRVWSNMQYIKPFATYEQTGYGRQWVSYGLRSLRPSSILTQPAGTPFVSHNPRYVRPAGIPNGYMGTIQIETHYNLVKVWGYLNEGYGTPSIRNNTPEIRVYGAFAFQPGGSPNVSLMRRYLRVPAGQDSGTVSAPFVSYRTRKIRPPSPDYLRWGNALVQFDQSQLAPPQQKIVPNSVQGGAGVVPNWEWEHPDAPYSGATIPLGYPVVKLNTIFAPSLGQIDKFGTPLTRSMVIFVDPGPASFAFGTVKLYGGTKWITQQATDLDEKFGNTKVVGSQIIHCGQKWDASTSTWYDWSFHTSQDPQDPWYYWRPQTAGPVFGYSSSVTLQHRRIYVSSYYWEWEAQGFATYGTPRVSTRPQYIRPAGLNSYKRGLPDVSYAGMKPVYVNSWADSGFGAAVAKVQDYGPKWVRPYGLAAGGMGVGRIELKHRRVYPTGIYQFASPKGAQYIGPYLRIYAKPGLDHSSFGTLYIDYKHRKVYQVDVTDDMEPWQTSAATRLKHQARGYFIEGTDFGVQFGLADVGDRVKRVRPAGWEEFETGFSYVPTSYPGLSKLKAQAFIMQPYTSTMEFGNGTVAHG
jgi:hypothetical protein